MATALRQDDQVLSDIWLKDQCAVMFELAKRHPGKNVYLSIRDNPTLILQSVGAFRQALRTDVGKFTKEYGALNAILGVNRFTSEDSRWRHLRDLSNPDIARPAPDHIVSVAETNFDRMCDHVEESLSVSPYVNFDRPLDQAGAETVCEAMLGFPLEVFGPDVFKDFRALFRMVQIVNYGGMGYAPHEIAEASSLAAKATRRLEKALAAVQGSDNAREGSEFALLKKIVDDSSGLVDTRGEILSLLAAGYETTSGSVGWALLLLAFTPALQEDLREEVNARIGNDPITAEALMSCTRLQAFYREALRIFPMVPILGRKATEDIRLDDTPVKEGDVVLLSIIGLHHDRNVHPKPGTVMPDRFPEGEIPPGMVGHYLPFSDGRRVCPGVKFANHEALTALAVILRRFRLKRGPEGPILYNWSFTMRRRGGQILKPEPVT